MDFRKSHLNSRQKHKGLWLFLSVCLALVFLLALGSGYSSVGLDRLPALISGKATEKELFVLVHLRLPRMVIMTFAGAALAVSGAMIQNVTRNDLADPGLLGISSGAGLGVAVVYLLFNDSGQAFYFGIPLAAIVGGLLAAAVISLSAKEHRAEPLGLILMGVCLSTALSGLMVLLVSSAEREKVDFIVKWLNGSIWASQIGFGLIIGMVLFAVMLIMAYYHKALDVIGLGEERAYSLGLEPEQVKRSVLGLAALLAAVAVAFSGAVAFVGLIAPHIGRRLTGPKSGSLIVSSAFVGALLLLVADTLGRTCFQPMGLPAGIITAVIGAPYLLWLMLKA